MPQDLLAYIIAAVIAAIPTCLSAILIFRGRRSATGDAEIQDRQAFYAALSQDNKDVRAQNDLLQQSNDELRRGNEQLETRNVLLERQNELLIDHTAEQDKKISALEHEVVLRKGENEKLAKDVIRLNRRVAELEGQRV